MAPSNYIEVDLRPFRSGPSRAAIRKRLLLNFANENPGTGLNEGMSRYRYLAETLSDGSVLSLTRPYRKNGMAFRIEVEGHKFRNRTTTPKYEDIYVDLLAKQEFNGKSYAKLLALIDAIYQCEDVKDKHVQSLIVKFEGTGLPVDLVLAICKWFFIEQDMVLWNTTGRDCEFYRNLPR